MTVVCVTGLNGFIGQNLALKFNEIGHQVVAIAKDLDVDTLVARLSNADWLVHLGGINRSANESDFLSGNLESTRKLISALRSLDRKIPIIYSSSTQAALDNLYGLSKRQAENALVEYGSAANVPIYIFRLPNVFGKWCRPNYNSAVATFCHNISRGLPINIDDPSKKLTLVYIDDVVESFDRIVKGEVQTAGFVDVPVVYNTTVGEVAEHIASIHRARSAAACQPVGHGLVRALNATYLSYVEPEHFSSKLTPHVDPRGSFVEVLKTSDCGQISYFTAHPGVTRGGHYHHTKTERFLVVSGKARFRFRHVLSGQTHELSVSCEEPEIVETVPGWSHSITNIGTTTMIAIVWASELFDPSRPDTVASEV